MKYILCHLFFSQQFSFGDDEHTDDPFMTELSNNCLVLGQTAVSRVAFPSISLF